MEVFSESSRILTLFSICPTDDTVNRWIKFRNVLIPILSLLIFVSFIGSAIAFSWHYLTTNLAAALYAIITIAAGSVSVYTLVAGYLLRKNILETFATFQTFYDTSKYSLIVLFYHYELKNLCVLLFFILIETLLDQDLDQSNFMKEANQRGNAIVTLALRFFVFGSLVILATMYIASIINSFFKCGTVDTQYLFNPYNMMYANHAQITLIYDIIYEKILFLFKFRLPWDQTTVLSWLFELVFGNAGRLSNWCLYLIFPTFFISICLFYQAFYKMFQAQIDQMDAIIEMKPFRVVKYKKLLCESIKFHISAKK